MQDERRRAPRRDVHCNAIFFDGHNDYRAAVSNVSRSGVWITTFELLPIGAKVRVSIDDEFHSKVIRAEGRVCRATYGRGMGVEFLTTPHDVDLLVRTAARAA